MEGFCGNNTSFWVCQSVFDAKSGTSDICISSDESLWRNERYPEVSSCFQQVVFIIIPSIFLILLAPYRLRHLYSSRSISGLNSLNIGRAVVSVLLCVLLIAEVVLSLLLPKPYPAYSVPPSEWLAYVGLFCALVLSVVIAVQEYRKGGRHFGGLFMFWYTLLVFGVLRLTLIILSYVHKENLDIVKLSALCAHLQLVLIQCILSMIPEPNAPGFTQKSSPSLRANYFSRITFWWFTGVIIKGYKRPLEETDLYDLDQSQEANEWTSRFEAHWNKAWKKCIDRNAETTSELVKVAISKNGNLPDDIGSGSGVQTSTIKLHMKNSNSEAEVSLKHHPSLLLCLAKVFLPSILIGSLYRLFHDLLLFASPLLLKLVIRFVEDREEPAWRGYVYGVIMFIVSIIVTTLLNLYFHDNMLVGMRLRAVISSAVYNKALKLNPVSRRESTMGEIVNLMSVDAQRFNDIMTYLNSVWSGPFQITISMVLLWQVLGPSILAGVALMVILVPINIGFANLQSKYQVKQMEEKDIRVKLMSEILNGIKVLKLYAWEESFQDMITDVRRKELKLLKKSGYIAAATMLGWQCAPTFVACATFLVYVLSSPDNVLDAEKAFVSLSIFNIMRFPMTLLPDVISQMVQISVSAKRVTKFLSLDELDPKRLDDCIKPEDCAISVEDASFSWEDHNDPNPTLSDINLDIKRGELIAVVGMVGSGKSSLMSAMLGDMLKCQGFACVRGGLAYVSQQAWIQNATLRDNILFGDELDTVRYQQVLEACALNPDLDMLPARDLTEIGEKGINLSGGQKARVSLARAVYNVADIYLLDDPLSAVDAHVGKHLFEKVIGSDGLLQAKTRILVTHGIGFLHHMDRIVVMKDGKISEIGSYKQLLSHAGAFAEFLKNYILEEQEQEGSKLSKETLAMEAEALKLASEVLHVDLTSMVRERASRVNANGGGYLSAERIANQISDTSNHRPKDADPIMHTSTRDVDVNLDGSVEAVEFKDFGDFAKMKDDVTMDILVEQEKSEIGTVKLRVFLKYAKAVGAILSFLIIVSSTMDHAASVGASLWLSKWIDDKTVANDTRVRDRYLGVFCGFGIAQGVVSFLSAVFIAVGCWMASRSVHHDLLVNILHCPMSFFDTTPTGRIMNRFTKDINSVDVLIPLNLRDVLWCALIVLGTMVVISTATPFFLVVVLGLAVLYIIFQRLYIATSRQLKRMESVALSPIYSHFSESIQGASTIRAFNKQKTFMNKSLAKINGHQKTFYPTMIANRWLSVRLEFLSSCVVLTTVMLAVYLRNSKPDATTVGYVALAITYSLGVMNVLNWMVRSTCNMETNIVAVERIKEYTEVSREADRIIPSCRPEPGWPRKGAIVFDNFSVRYRAGLDLVLKSINCQINGGEKVGIVGRTGAGKSSFALALFRIIEKVDGEIRLDDIAIDSVGLHDLRKNLTIIPQDPVLFSGTLRMNMDPFQQYTDEQLWQALKLAHLKDFVQNLELKLEFICDEGGSNLSVGQRQLVCLARALLRHTKVLVLDEATAAVDLETDDLIQSTLRSAFSDCTVLTIAHRINTIMDYDRIMVLSAGEIKEFATPQELLSDKEGLFYSLAKEAKLIS